MADCWPVVFAFLVGSIVAEVVPTEDYLHNARLDNDGNVEMFWKFNDTHITFEVYARTRGWIGIGISPNGGMANADIFVGWVKDGIAYVTDRHGSGGNGYPAKDTEQNVELLDGSECDGWTMIKFQRQIAACEEFDLEITGDTLKIIYAYGENDPKDEDLNKSDDYHGVNRGVKSMYLLDVAKSDEIMFPEGETHMSFDLLNDNFHVPSQDTYYNCRLHKLPTFTEKHHLVKVEPIIQPGNELHVHHILVYQCTRNLEDSLSFGTNAKCYGSNMPPDFESCSFVIQAWAIGGGAFYYPKHAGFPLGDRAAPKYVVVETHYDNPNIKPDIFDSSGLRFVYTSQLRQYDSGILEAGHTVSGYQQIIPPNAQSYLQYGECTDQCLEGAMKMKNLDQINVFAATMHSHLLGRGLTLKHVRNGTELSPISKDSSYDFNYQESRLLSEERILKVGDSLQVVCNYNSQDKTEITMGGLPTTREMCLVFVYFYPKIPLNFCQTSPEFNEFMSYFGIESTMLIGDGSVYEDLDAFLVLEPSQLANQTVAEVINSMEWNDETSAELSEAMRYIYRIENCVGPLGKPPQVEWYHPALSIDIPYVEENLTCNEPSTGWPTSNEASHCFVDTTPVTITTEATTPSNIVITPTEDYQHSAVLDNDEKFWMFWKFNETHITLEVYGQTTGWVGLGISPKGGMSNSDIFVGWVKDGIAHGTDRHGSDGNGYPPKDTEQNVELLDGSECDGWTMIKFQRQLAACEEFDLEISGDTLNIIYAYGENDPESEDLKGPDDYHGGNRGAKNLTLVGASKAGEVMLLDEENHLSIVIRNGAPVCVDPNVELPTSVDASLCGSDGASPIAATTTQPSVGDDETTTGSASMPRLSWAVSFMSLVSLFNGFRNSLA
ncbi:unnamed protein product [Clavelina lepadiformis]|uniref:DOMON domain-containing protein n=2 Tax=Clavelina lepadiformis TaxID=159417 RepID=A0ABP0EWN1_CLALP